MRKLHCLVGIIGLSALFPLSAATQPVATVKADSEQQRIFLSVSFARQTVREGDAVDVELWLLNERAEPLTESRLHVSAPDFVSWHTGGCAASRGAPMIRPPLDLGDVPAFAFLTRTLCARTKAEIKSGDFNVLFTLEYEWKSAGKRHRAFVAAEKPVKAVLFGTESVAGIPVAIAGFVVPGLFFWLVMDLFAVPWVAGRAMTDKVLYSFVASVVFLIAGNWLGLVDTESAIGIATLARLAAAGAALGLLAGATYRLSVLGLRWAVGKRRAARIIAPGDDVYTKLHKLVVANPGRRYPKTTVRVGDGREFVGALGAEMSGTVWLAGWYRLHLAGVSETVMRRLRRLYEEGENSKLLKVARAEQVPIAERDSIRGPGEMGPVPSGKMLMWWSDPVTLRLDEDDAKKPFLDLD